MVLPFITPIFAHVGVVHTSLVAENFS